MGIKQKAFKTALPYTIPICAAFLFIGFSYGFYMSSKGFSFVYPMLMSLFIFAGSMEFVTVNLLLSAFNPVYAFLLTLMVNARHLFYGISMLDKFKKEGKKRLYLIFGMCDESFSINCTTKIPEDVDKEWFMFYVTLLNHIYWVMGSTLGGLFGSFVHFDTKGIEFVMTALFIVIFLNQWREAESHIAALIGIGASILCLLMFGAKHFMIPAMGLIVLCFILAKRTLEGAESEEKTA